MTITLHAWWLWWAAGYLAVGIVLYLPLAYLFWRQAWCLIEHPPSFGRHLRLILGKEGVKGVVIVFSLWPMFVWDLCRSHVK